MTTESIYSLTMWATMHARGARHHALDASFESCAMTHSKNFAVRLVSEVGSVALIVAGVAEAVIQGLGALACLILSILPPFPFWSQLWRGNALHLAAGMSESGLAALANLAALFIQPWDTPDSKYQVQLEGWFNA